MNANRPPTILRIGARSLIVLGLAPVTSMSRLLLWLTDVSNSQSVSVPLSTRANSRPTRSLSVLPLARSETSLEVERELQKNYCCQGNLL